ncbi:hypothetical protein ASG85_05285 [Paenibacillus sp. Soil724D2]|nr:hypothetical protein ASG85_05285 [Paenibacillus sp. Soil724D2]
MIKDIVLQDCDHRMHLKIQNIKQLVRFKLDNNISVQVSNIAQELGMSIKEFHKKDSSYKKSIYDEINDQTIKLKIDLTSSKHKFLYS